MTGPLICSECVSDANFSDWIVKNGKEGCCEINTEHEGVAKVVHASDLAAEVDKYFRENYGHGNTEPFFYDDADSPSYEQQGSSYVDIMVEELGCDEEVVLAFNDYLPDASHSDIMDGGECFYDDSVCYRSLESMRREEEAEEEQYWYEERYRIQWKEFCYNVTFKNRFFGAKESLDNLFGNPSDFEQGNVCPVYYLDKGTKIFRARLLTDDVAVSKVIADPSNELGAPPKELAREGRMNVQFIPAFYAAFSEGTAVAEVRPSVGEHVAIGKFENVERIRVFDFTVFHHSSNANWRDAVAHTRYDFIVQMEREISKPVFSSDRVREYLPTQVVAEYIGQVLQCDAVIYRSSLMRDDKIDARNIVILNKEVSFVGKEQSLIKFISYEIHDVDKVCYDLSSHIPF